MTPWMIRRKIDLAQVQQRIEYLGALMYTGDARGHEIAIEVTQTGTPVDLSGSTVRAYIVRPDARTVMITGTASSNIVSVVLSAECYACSGQINIVIRIENNSTTVALYAASATVRMSATDAIVDPGDTIPSLSDLLAQVDAMAAGTREANAAATAANTAAASADTITRNATAAETARVNAENARKMAETARGDAETKRTSAESARVTAESSRASAEGTRVSAENARKTAETARGDAETKRTSTESARVTAESSRASAEGTRVSAENARKTAETARGDAETKRTSAESARVTAEKKRETDSAQALQDARDATAAADGWARAEATAKTLPVGSQATAKMTTAADGHKILELGMPTGATGATGAQGRSLRPKGSWAASVAYVYNTQYADVVMQGGSSYVCIASHTSSSGNAPPAAAYWTLLASKGSVDNLPGMRGATAEEAGKSGLVPAPAAGTQGRYLRGDGTWQTPTNTTYGVATASADGLMSKGDKAKLDGVAANANNYAHPTNAGNKHIPSGGASGQILRWSADGTAAWGADNNTTYSPATGSADGLMSSADKKKLDGFGDADSYLDHSVAFSLPVSAWTGSGPYSAVISDARFAPDIKIDSTDFSADTIIHLPNAAIDYETAAGKITLTTAIKPSGTLAGTFWARRVAQA